MTKVLGSIPGLQTFVYTCLVGFVGVFDIFLSFDVRFLVSSFGYYVGFCNYKQCMWELGHMSSAICYPVKSIFV